MVNSYGKYYFYNGLYGDAGKYYQTVQKKAGSVRDEIEQESKQVNKQENALSFMGIKLSYSKAFGVAFLVLFLLLFFPGIGVSSSAVKNIPKTEEADKENSLEETKFF